MKLENNLVFKHRFFADVIPIVKMWFEGYKDPGKIVFMCYENKKKTINYIKKSHERCKRDLLKKEIHD